MRSNNHLRVFLHQLLLRFFPPLILILLFIQRPLSSVLRLFSIQSFLSTTFQGYHKLFPTTPNTANPVLAYTRPTPLCPLHFIYPLRLPHPFIHMSIRLQALEKSSAIPRRKIRCSTLVVHCRYWGGLLSCRCRDVQSWGLRDEDTCTGRNVCRSRARDSRLLCRGIHCGGESGGGGIMSLVIGRCS